MTITSEQIKAARSLLRWEQSKPVEASRVSLATIKRIESRPGEVEANQPTIDAIRRAIEEAGVGFTNGDRPGVQWLGWKWYIDVYNADGTKRSTRYYPDFEATLAAATRLVAELQPPEKPLVHTPAEALDAQRAAIKSLGLAAIWP